MIDPEQKPISAWEAARRLEKSGIGPYSADEYLQFILTIMLCEPSPNTGWLPAESMRRAGTGRYPEIDLVRYRIEGSLEIHEYELDEGEDPEFELLETPMAVLRHLVDRGYAPAVEWAEIAARGVISEEQACRNVALEPIPAIESIPAIERPGRAAIDLLAFGTPEGSRAGVRAVCRLKDLTIPAWAAEPDETPNQFPKLASVSIEITDPAHLSEPVPEWAKASAEPAPVLARTPGMIPELQEIYPVSMPAADQDLKTRDDTAPSADSPTAGGKKRRRKDAQETIEKINEVIRAAEGRWDMPPRIGEGHQRAEVLAKLPHLQYGVDAIRAIIEGNYPPMKTHGIAPPWTRA